MPENQGSGEGVPLGTTDGRGGAAPAVRPTATAFTPPGGQPQPQTQPYGYGPGGPAAPPPPPPGYGTPPGPGYGPGYGPGPGWAPFPPPATSGICTAAMVLGIVSMVLVTTFYGMVVAVLTGPVAIGLGLVARGRVKRGEAHGSGQATAGLVLGIVSFVVSAVAITLAVLAFTVWDIDRSGEDSWENDTHHTEVLRAPAADRTGPDGRH